MKKISELQVGTLGIALTIETIKSYYPLSDQILSQKGSTTSISSIAAPPKVGDRVIVSSQVGGSKTGTLRYIGPTDFAQGEWAGVELVSFNFLIISTSISFPSSPSRNPEFRFLALHLRVLALG